MHRRDVQLQLFIAAMVLSVAAGLALLSRGVNGFWLVLFFPVAFWPFGLRH